MGTVASNSHVFEDKMTTLTGSLAGQYLWSNGGNWSNDLVPLSGQAITLNNVASVDDLSSISLSSVVASGLNYLDVAGASLIIGTFDTAPGFQIYAGISAVSTPVTVTIDSVNGSGGVFGAIGANARLIDLATTDPGETYFASDDGAVTLNAAPVETSTLELGGALGGTIALENLAPGTYGARLEGVAIGDVLELPGSAINSVSFGSKSLTIATSSTIGQLAKIETFAFSNVQFVQTITGDIASYDAATGMELITLTGTDTFTAHVSATSGAYLWSNPANWSTGNVPEDGGMIVIDGTGIDDIASLSLSSVTETGADNNLNITGTSLAIGTIDAASGFAFYAGSLGISTPVTVTVDSVNGSGGVFGAIGSNAAFIDLATTDPGATYFVGFTDAVTLNAAPAASSVLQFGGGTLALDNLSAGTYGAEIVGLASGDVLELPGTAVSSASFHSHSLTIATSEGSGLFSTVETFAFSNVSFSSRVTGETATYDAATGMELITLTDVTCFVAGTKILTSRGERPVESLRIGDSVKTLHAGEQKIKWIGTRSYDGRFIARNKAARPICIKQNAIDRNVPARDLFVSPGHAICIDGVLVHAARLVNGVSVCHAAAVDNVTYYHIELESHEIIFAENCAAETFLGEAFRQQFQNAAVYALLYPGESAPEATCLPRLDGGFQLQAIQQRIAARAGIEMPAPPVPGPLRGYVDQAGPTICSGWVQDVCAPEAPVCLDITVDGRTIGRVLANEYRADLYAAGLGSGYHGFALHLPAGIAGRVDAVRTADRSVLTWTENAAAQVA
jgi:hypothetical protein